MDTLTIMNIVMSIVLLGLIVLAIFKKLNIVFSFFVVSLIGMVYYTLANGLSVQGDASIGNSFLDMFEYITSIFSKQNADNIMILMSVMGYVAYMNHIKATNLLCLTLGQPLRKLGKPFVVVAGTIVFTAVLKWAIFSNTGQAALILATLYPIMLSLGVSKQTAASAVMFGGAIVWGPAAGLTIIVLSMAPTDLTVSEIFGKYELINVTVSLILAITVFYFTSKYFDKKEGAKPEVEWAAIQDPKELQLPGYYCIFPFLPVILVLIFSTLVVKTIVISITAANILSFMFVAFVEIIRKKEHKKAMDETIEFWKGCGGMMATSGGLVIAANVFSGVIVKIGGITALFKLFLPTEAGAGIGGLIIGGSIAAFLFTIVSQSVVSMASLFGALFAGIAEPMGVSMHLVAKTLIPAGSVSLALCPVSAGNLFVAQATGNDVLTLVKRCIPPCVVYSISSIIITQFILVG